MEEIDLTEDEEVLLEEIHGEGKKRPDINKKRLTPHELDKLFNLNISALLMDYIESKIK